MRVSLQLRNVKDGEGFVVVSRVLLADSAPRDAERTPVLIGFEEFAGMFRTFAHPACRPETRRRYQSDEEAETYQRFVRGEDAGWDLNDPWCVSRREQSAPGKRFERVRIADNPPTPGQRHLLDNARRNSAVGEDIRNLWRSEAEALQLPDEDFWLFGSRGVARLQSGPRALRSELGAAHAWWNDQGRPGFERFGLTVTPEGTSRAWLNSPEYPVPAVG